MKKEKTLAEHIAYMNEQRMKKLSPERRKEIAKKAVEARIKKYNQKRRLTSLTRDDIMKK